MRKRTLSLILALVLAFSLITGDIVPVFGETTASSEEDKDILYSTPASDDGGNVIVGEYEEGEIIVLYQPDKNASVKESTGNDRSGSDSVEAADLMAMSEDLMDVSEGAAAIEADREDSSKLQADGFSGQNETAVIKLIKSDRYSTEELLKMYRDFPGVLYAEPNYIGHIEEDDEISLLNEEDNEISAFNEEDINYESITPDGDAAVKAPDVTGYQYAYRNGAGGMEVPDWNVAGNVNAGDTVVAVVDSGVDYEHPDLAPVMWDQGENYKELVEIGGGKYGYNAAWELGDAPSKDPMDVQGHGTHCAGIIAAAWNDFGASGIANGAKIMAIRHTNTGGGNKTSDTLKGYNYIKKAKELGVNVVAVNNSWGAEGESEIILGYSISELAELGIVSCFAASNEGKNNDIHAHTASTLGDQPGGIMVGAVNNKGERASFSDYGKRTTHIFAPGDEIMSTYVRFKSATFPDMKVSPPMKDENGETAADEFTNEKTWFQIEKNAASGATFTVADDSLQIRNVVLKPVAEMDDITRETVEVNPPENGNIATICTLKPKAALSKEKLISFGITAKTTAEGAKDNEFVRVYAKTKDGRWDRPTLTEPLTTDYAGKVYDLERGQATGAEFDLDDIEIRLVVYNADPLYKDIDVSGLWFTDTGKIPYKYDSGTSMATPAVAGELAVLAAAFPNDSAQMRVARVMAGANRQDNFTDLCITGGMANVKNSLDQSTYTPVINNLTTYWDGLHLIGFFLGEKANLEVTIKEGDLTFTTADGSLSVNEVFTLEDGGQEAVVSMPQALKAGEVTVTVRNTAATPGRTDYTRVMTLDDPDGYLSPCYPRTPLTTDLNGIVPINMVGWNGSLILTGMGALSNIQESWIGYDGGKGTWSKLPTGIEKKDNGNVINWNQRLLYINNEGELCIHDPITGTLDRSVLTLTNDRQIAKDEVSALYYDGERVLLVWTPINAATGKTEASQIWEVSPGTFAVKHLGDLNGSYGAGNGGMNVPIIAHTTEADGKTGAYYIFGVDDLSENDMAEMERFTTGSSLASAKVALKYPEGGEMVFSQVFSEQDSRLYNGCAFAGDNGDGAMMITGMFRVSDGKAMNPVVLDDNYFIKLNDSKSELEVVPSEQKASPAKLLNMVICAYEGRAYIMGEQAGDSESLYFTSTPVPTWPAYGDQVQTDPTVKVKKLTLSKTKVTLEQGKTEKLSAAPAFKDPGTYAAVVFASSNTDVATVDADGTVHAKNAGTAVITASCGDKTASCTVTVDAKATPKLNKTETTLKEGEKDLLILNDAIVNGKEKITWKSSNSKIVTVNKGLLMAKKAGTADVYATWKSGKETLNFTCKVTVEDITVPKAASDDKAVKLSVGKSSVKLNRNDTAEISAKLSGADFTKRTIDFKSLNPNVVNFGEAGDSVTLSGNALVKTDITGQGAGIAYIVVESYDPSVVPAVKNRKLVKVTVNSPAESIEFTGVSNSSVKVSKGTNTINMKTGSVTAVSYKLSPEVCTDFSKVKWSVGKGGTVTVKNGVITAKKASAKDGNGEYIPSIVTASCGNKKMEIRVIVE